MKIFLPVLLLLLASASCFAQTETEPNNTFAEATDLPMFTDYTALVDGNDVIDYVKLNFTANQGFYLLVEATNIGGPDAFLKMDMYDGREAPGLIYTRNIAGNITIHPDETVYDTIYLCGKAADDYFLAFTTNGNFDYRLYWLPVNSYPNDEPNDNAGAAFPFFFNVSKPSSIKYDYRGNSNADTEDWFTSTVLPAANYNNVNLNLVARNTSCSGGTKWIHYDCYKMPNLTTAFASGYISNTMTAAPDVPLLSTIPLNNMQQGDVFKVRITSNAAFGYSLMYGDIVPYEDPEDNCCRYNALPWALNQTLGGNVGRYDQAGDQYIDEYDMYRVITPHYGALKISVAAENADCGSDDLSLEFDLMDKDGYIIEADRQIMTWIGGTACNTLLHDSVTITAMAQDTFYIRLHARTLGPIIGRSNFTDAYVINYNIKYQGIDSVGTDPEPNNDSAHAVLISQGQTRKGTLNFKKSVLAPDNFDYYKTVLPVDGNLTVYIKGRYRGQFLFNNNAASRLKFYFPNNNFTKDIPLSAAQSFLQTDSVYYDTIRICPAAAGTAYFYFNSSKAWEYEFSYALTDTTTWSNDIEPNNSFAEATTVAENVSKTGRLKYYSDILNSVPDQNDYYRLPLPVDGTLKVYIEGRNSTCANASALIAYLYDRGHHNYITKNVGNLSTVPAGATIYDTLTLCGRSADTMFLAFQASNEFRYRFRFQVIDTSQNDVEPNNTLAQATRIQATQLKKGHIYYLNDYNTNGYDYYDFYKIAVASNDSLKLYIQGTNMSCTTPGQSFQVHLFLANQTNLLAHNIGNTTNILPGQTVFDTVKIAIVSGEDIFIRFIAGTQFKYQFSTNLLKPASNFSITGDTTACLGVQEYRAINVLESNLVYNWSLPLGGGTISNVDSIATVNWTSTGNRRIQLNISNAAGTSPNKLLNVVVNGSAPTQVPVLYNFARTLSTNSLPPGATCQWYKDNVLIPGATDSSYYAASAGTFTVKFINDCGPGVVSNAISFPAAAQPQSITLIHTPNTTMSPTARVKLNATASSGLPVYFQKISGSGTIVNDTLYITGAGTIIVKALQPGDDVYSAAVTKNDTIVVTKGNQLISFDSIPNQVLDASYIFLSANASSGNNIAYSITSGAAFAAVGGGGALYKTGTGIVTVRASQDGNANYNAATPVERTFCLGIRSLSAIIGEPSPCISTYTYTTQKIPGANFTWTLSGGGSMTTHNDTAFIQWQTAGSYTLKVKAKGTCDTTTTNEQQFSISTSSNVPGVVSNMQPANGSVGQQLPLTLSWIPGATTVNYDLYVWDSAVAQPGTPYASNITTVSRVLPLNSFAYNKTYKWRVIAKNPCAQTVGPVQTFRLIPLADLVVNYVQGPLNANSGQTITINWKVTNNGPGKTLTAEKWTDAVFLSLDTTLAMSVPPQTDSHGWGGLTFPIRPLLLATKQNVTALDSGAFYTNSIDYTLPLQLDRPYYLFVVTDFPTGTLSPLQTNKVNDTTRGAQPINVTLSPTPDLRVDSIFTPASAFSGSTINLSYKVKNYGVVTPAASVWQDSVFLCQSQLFDRSTAIPLNSPKSNGSYYPGAPGAVAYNSTQLNAGSTYTKNMAVVIPNKLFGTWFLYVKTNAGTALNNSVYEGSLGGNNLNQSQLQIYLTPTPKLTVSTLDVAVTAASTTQPIGINWNILNEGFTDNLEKNKGHYLTHVINHCPCTSSVPNGVCIGAPIYQDSLVQGASYWVDRVYLSTDASLNIANARLLQEVPHGTLNSALLYPDNIMTCGYVGLVNGIPAVIPGANFPSSSNFNIPSDMEPGSYYVYVYTNPTKTVFEYPGTPQIKRSALPVVIQRPDVTVPSITLPANSNGGQAITINYSIYNNGPGSVFNHLRRDRLYISNFSSFDGSAQLLATQNFTESVPAGTAVAHSFTYSFAAAATGAKYFYVQTNYDSLFKETNAANNTSAGAMTTVAAAVASDLVVSLVKPLDTVFTIFPGSFRFTVSNNGAGAASGTWTDSIFISCSSSFSSATSYFIAKRTQTRSVAPGANYSDTFNLTLPIYSYDINSCFPQTMYGNAYFYVKTNANQAIYEGAGIGNNTAGSGSKVLANPLVDHIVTTVSGTDSATVGRPYPINWRVKNIGYNPNSGSYYQSFYDAAYFSADSIVDAGDPQVGLYYRGFTLNRNQDSADSKTATAPNLPAGDYYVYIRTNYNGDIRGEKVLSNNTNFIRTAGGAAKKIHLTRPSMPDLTDSLIAPASVAAGQPLTIIFRVKNNGSGITYPNSWRHEIRLSTDFVYGTGDGYLNNELHSGALAPGAYYYDTVTIIIPVSTAPGNYVLIGMADNNNFVAEDNENNNFGLSLLTIYQPQTVDLVIDNIIKPDSVYLGYSIDTAKWIVRNISPNAARGQTKDGLYLSKSELLDATAVLLGVKSKTIDMQPLAADTVRFAPRVIDVTEGSYYMIAAADIQNAFLETDKANNVYTSPSRIYVKVKEVKLNIPATTTLQADGRYYKLLIPDSLIGSTIRITLKTPDSLSMRNEMYVSGGAVPSSFNYDYRFEIPNYGNQQIVITDVADHVYYILFSCVSTNPVLQNVTLKAEVLPFAILNVNAASGGNSGNVTVKLSGSLFSNDMTAKLIKGATTITASAFYYTNSTTVYATFNLQGAALGLYNVSLVKADAATATMPNGFTVVAPNNGGLITGGGVNTGSGNGTAPGCDPGAASGLNSQLSVQMIVPPTGLIQWPFVIQINYSNPTNVDIPAQSRILYSEAGIKLALTPEGVATGTTALYLELTEPGGPPGIIRAGANCSITVYSRSPDTRPLNPFVHFKLQ